MYRMYAIMLHLSLKRIEVLIYIRRYTYCLLSQEYRRSLGLQYCNLIEVNSHVVSIFLTSLVLSLHVSFSSSGCI